MSSHPEFSLQFAGQNGNSVARHPDSFNVKGNAWPGSNDNLHPMKAGA